MAFVTCSDLAVGNGGIVVVRHISCAVGAGDLLCVVGENGAGKSTFVRTVLGLQPALEGTVALGDDCSPRDVAYLPQASEVRTDFPASVWEVALSGRLPRLGMRPFYSQADRAAAREALRHTGALDLRDRPLSRLSGGQRQRVLLARALAGASKVVVLDEPTTGLDPEAASSLWGLLDVLRDDGMGIIVVTHEVGEASAHATQVMGLRGGEAFLMPMRGAGDPKGVPDERV